MSYVPPPSNRREWLPVALLVGLALVLLVCAGWLAMTLFAEELEKLVNP